MATQATVEEGQAAPDFSLETADGQVFSLRDFRGKKMVLYFYPKDMTPACTQQACDFRDFSPQILASGAVIIGISPDLPQSHGKFAQKHSLPFPLLSDPLHQVCELYGVWQLKKNYGREYMGVERSTFVIDAEGKIAKQWRKVRVKGHVAEVLAAVQAL